MRVVNSTSKKSAQRYQVLFLVFICLSGGIVRILLAEALPFRGDEPGTMKWICSSPRYILSHYETWLTMNWFILVLKGIAHVFGESLFAMRCLPLTAGILSIAAAALLAARLFQSRRAGLVAAALFAAHPLLIWYSADARAYAVLVFFTLCLWLAVIYWRENPSWKSSFLVGVISLLLLLTHLNGVFLLLWLCLVVITEAIRRRRDVLVFCADGLRLGIALASCLWPAALFYYGMRNRIRVGNIGLKMQELGVAEHILRVLEIYFDIGNVAGMVACCFVFCFGLWVLWNRNRFYCAWAVIFFIIPIGFACATEYSYSPSHSVRYFVFILPLCIVVLAAGISRIADFARDRSYIVIVAVVFAFISAWSPSLRKQFREVERLPFQDVYRFIASQQQPGDRIIGLEPFTLYLLSAYMPCDQRRAASDLWQGAFPVRSLLEDPEKGRVFVVSSSPSLALSELRVPFGEIEVTTLSPEPYAARYGRLLAAYEEALRAFPPKHKPNQSFVYRQLAELARIRGDEKAFAYYESQAVLCDELGRQRFEHQGASSLRHTEQ